MKMCVYLKQLPWPGLLMIAGFMLFAPFQPMPHLMEKWQMFRNGTLTKPIDIFDVFWHLLPLIVIALKLYCERTAVAP